MLCSGPLRRLFCGKPVLLIDNGRLLQGNLRLTRVTLDELFGKLREKDILDITQVQYAILETDGNLSVFPYAQFAPASAKDAGVRVKENSLPIVVAEDGRLFPENLQKAGKDLPWVEQTLATHEAVLEDTLLLIVDGSGKVVFVRKERL